jgi:hypothetical protein
MKIKTKKHGTLTVTFNSLANKTKTKYKTNSYFTKKIKKEKKRR